MQSSLSEVLLEADSRQAFTQPRSTISEEVKSRGFEQTGDNVVSIKWELEEAKQAAEKQAAYKHAQEEERMRHLAEEAENRLKTEQHRLQAEYVRHAEELLRFKDEALYGTFLGDPRISLTNIENQRFG